MMNSIETDSSGKRHLKLSFEVNNFKPEEIEISTDSTSRCIVVNAKSRSTNENTNQSVVRHYSRSFYIPENMVEDVSKMEMNSTITDGHVTIDALLPNPVKVEMIEGNTINVPLEAEKPREIPIKQI